MTTPGESRWRRTVVWLRWALVVCGCFLATPICPDQRVPAASICRLDKIGIGFSIDPEGIGAADTRCIELPGGTQYFAFKVWGFLGASSLDLTSVTRQTRIDLRPVPGSQRIASRVWYTGAGTTPVYFIRPTRFRKARTAVLTVRFRCARYGHLHSRSVVIDLERDLP